jgi:DNA-binding FadR family transcriptional regulator
MPLSHSATRPLSPPRNLASELARRLGAEIVAGKLKPRTRLPTEHALMATFGVSRTVVREAIAALRAEGLVETRQGSGAFVATDPRGRPFRIDPEGLKSIPQVLDVMELRICVEVEAAGLAASRRTRADVARINRIGGAFAAAVADGDAAVGLDFDFHAAIGAATGNPYFSAFLDFIGSIIIPRRTILVDAQAPAKLGAYLARVREEHEAIAEAIAAGDAKAASAAMRVHLTRGRDRYRRLMAEEKRPRGRTRRSP